MTVKRVWIEVLTGNIFDVTTEGFDVQASLRTYARQLSDTLRKHYPEADVFISMQSGEGFGNSPRAWDERGRLVASELATIDHIDHEVWSRGEWYVELRPT